jgi:hypothetical protein
MSFPWRAAVVVLSAGCAVGTPAARQPAPSPSAPRPNLDPLRIEPPRDLAVRYPNSGGGIARYALARHDTVTATMPAGDTQVQVFGRIAFITLTWIASDTGTRITAAVDSVVADSGLGGFSVMADSARGARWSALRRPTGQLVDLSGGPRSLIGDQVRDQLQLLFPVLPAKGAHPGEGWSDSSSGMARVSAFEATETVRSASRAETLVSPDGVLPLSVVRNRIATGQGTQFGQPMTLRATGSDTLTYQIASDGLVLVVEGVRLTDLVVELPSIGQSVPAHERSSLRMVLRR